MEIGNLSSMMEVIIGLNLASVLFDSFNLALFKYFLGDKSSDFVNVILKNNSSYYQETLSDSKRKDEMKKLLKTFNEYYDVSPKNRTVD